MIKKYLKTTIATAALISALQAMDVPVVDGVPQDFDLKLYQAGRFNPAYRDYLRDPGTIFWCNELIEAMDNGYRNVIHFLLNHKDFNLPANYVWQQLCERLSKHPKLLSFMLADYIPSQYRLPRTEIYSKKGHFSLTVEDIKNIKGTVRQNQEKKAENFAPNTEEESRILYYRVFVMNKSIEEVEKLFAALPDLLPLLTRQNTYNEDYCYEMKQIRNMSEDDYTERTGLREAFLQKLPKTPAELEEEDNKARADAAYQESLLEEQRQKQLAEKNRLALWDTPLPRPLTLIITPDSAADVWQAFYGVQTFPVGCFQSLYKGDTFSENDILTILSGAVIQFANKDGQKVQGRLVGVSGSKTTYTQVGIYYPRYTPSVVSISVWEELRATMQANQPKKGSMSASQDQQNPRMINLIYSFGEAPAECYLYKLFLKPEGF